MNKASLDKRICDCEEEATNTQTYREFIRQSEDWFGIDAANLDAMCDDKLKHYINFLDYLWLK